MSISAGTNGPEQWIRPQNITTPVTATDYTPAGTLYEGATVANATTYSRRINIAGAANVRIRFKASAAGTLSFAFMRPDGQTAYTAGNPTNVSVSANTETLIDTTSVGCFGEAWALVSFAASGAGSVTLFDVMAL